MIVSVPPRTLIVAPNLLYGEPNPRSIRARRLVAGLHGGGLPVETLTWWSGVEEPPAELGGAPLLALHAPGPLEALAAEAAEAGGEGGAVSEPEAQGLGRWAELATDELCERPRRERPQLIYAIGVPVGAIVAGARIAKALGVPCIADLGDPWPVAGPAQEAEREAALAGCAALVTTTSELGEDFRPLLPAGAPVELIPNGGELRTRHGLHDPPLFVHMGAINAGRIDPRPAFEALAALHEAGRIEFRSHTTGFHPDLGSLPHPHLPMLDHAEALELTASAAAALVLGNDNAAQLPSKAFEIGCTETWALCVSRSGDERDPATAALRPSGHAVAAPNEAGAITAAAELILEREARGARPEPVAAFSWESRIVAVRELIWQLT